MNRFEELTNEELMAVDGGNVFDDIYRAGVVIGVTAHIAWNIITKK